MNTEMTTTQAQNAPAREARAQRYVKPYYEVETGTDAYNVRVFMPGVAKAGVKITLEGDRLFIQGSRGALAPESWKPLHREIPDADFRLQLELNVHIDEKHIEARTENGVLNLRLPVAEAAKPRQITIE
jgi:HSP20 family protein